MITMGKFEEYLDRAKDLAEDAGDAAKKFAEDVRSKAKELADEDSKVKELAQGAREQAAAISFGAKEKMQGALQDVRAGKEIKAGIAELENLPEFEGSIIYKMELEAMINDLRKLMLFIEDNRLDDVSVIEEVGKVMAKVQPAAVNEAEEAPELTDEEKAIENAKTIAYSACTRALTVLKASAQQV